MTGVTQIMDKTIISSTLLLRWKVFDCISFNI